MMMRAALPAALFFAPGPAGAQPGPKAPAGAPRQDDGRALIEKAVQAFGGAAAVDAVTALEVRTRGTRHIQAEDLPVTILTRYYFPDRYYQELTLPMGTLKTVLGPDSAFIVAGEGTLPLPEGERQSILKLMRRNVVAVLRARRQPDFSAEVTGSDTVEGTAVKLVRVTHAGDEMTLAIDPATGEVRQTRFESAGGATPTGVLIVTLYDYRPVDTILTLRYPVRAAGIMDGKPAFAQTVEAVVVNPKLDAALFKAPPGHAMFPGVEDLPLSPPPTLLPHSASPGPSPSPSASPGK